MEFDSRGETTSATGRKADVVAQRVLVAMNHVKKAWVGDDGIAHASGTASTGEQDEECFVVQTGNRSMMAFPAPTHDAAADDAGWGVA